jgi:hypothetical protein
MFGFKECSYCFWCGYKSVWDSNVYWYYHVSSSNCALVYPVEAESLTSPKRLPLTCNQTWLACRQPQPLITMIHRTSTHKTIKYIRHWKCTVDVSDNVTGKLYSNFSEAVVLIFKLCAIRFLIELDSEHFLSTLQRLIVRMDVELDIREITKLLFAKKRDQY